MILEKNDKRWKEITNMSRSCEDIDKLGRKEAEKSNNEIEK